MKATRILFPLIGILRNLPEYRFSRASGGLSNSCIERLRNASNSIFVARSGYVQLNPFGCPWSVLAGFKGCGLRIRVRIRRVAHIANFSHEAAIAVGFSAASFQPLPRKPRVSSPITPARLHFFVGVARSVGRADTRLFVRQRLCPVAGPAAFRWVHGGTLWDVTMSLGAANSTGVSCCAPNAARQILLPGHGRSRLQAP